MPPLNWNTAIAALLIAGIIYLVIRLGIRMYFEEKRRHTAKLIKDIAKGENE